MLALFTLTEGDSCSSEQTLLAVWLQFVSFVLVDGLAFIILRVKTLQVDVE